jgi:hypothetical protein
MLLGALAALIAWGIAFLILRTGHDTVRIAVAAVAGVAVSIAACWLAAGAMGLQLIWAVPIAGALVGVVAAVVGAKRSSAAPKA